jgi:K+-transporting ATPase ATPase C chain
MILICTVLLGGVYTLAMTGIVQLLFPAQAAGSIIKAPDGSDYGSALLAQPFGSDTHLWGRAMTPNTMFKAADGSTLFYAGPTNISPAAAEYGKTVAAKVQMIRAANPEMGESPVPEGLVTTSGSGLDPEISPAAAAYQVKRLARTTGRSEDEVRAIIKACTTGRWCGVFGEPRVNVLKVNLMLDGKIAH